MESNLKEKAGRWLLHAERDLGFGKLGLEIGGFYAQACLMAHQSAEKALKAMLYLRGARLVQERSISELLLRAADVHPGLSRYQDMASKLDQYYLISRYLGVEPGGASSELVDEAQAKEAMGQGENLILEIRNLLRFGR